MCHRELRPMTQKRSAKDRTAVEWKSVAKATRRRRRNGYKDMESLRLQAGERGVTGQ